MLIFGNIWKCFNNYISSGNLRLKWIAEQKIATKEPEDLSAQYQKVQESLSNRALLRDEKANFL